MEKSRKGHAKSMKSLTFLWLFIDLSPFCLTVKWLKSHKKSRKKSRKSGKVNRLFMTFSWLRSQLSVNKSQEMFLDFLWLFVDWVVEFQSKKVIKKSIKSYWLYTDFFWLFLDLKVRKSRQTFITHQSIYQSHEQYKIYFLFKKRPPLQMAQKGIDSGK